MKRNYPYVGKYTGSSLLVLFVSPETGHPINADGIGSADNGWNESMFYVYVDLSKPTTSNQNTKTTAADELSDRRNALISSIADDLYYQVISRESKEEPKNVIVGVIKQKIRLVLDSLAEKGCL